MTKLFQIACVYTVVVTVNLFGSRAIESQETSVELSHSPYSGASEEGPVLLAEFRKRYLELTDFYKNMAMSAVERQYHRPVVDSGLPIFDNSEGSNLLPGGLTKYDYWARDGIFYKIDGSEYDSNDETLLIRKQTGLIGPEESYMLGWDPVAERYFLMAHGKNDTQYAAILRSYNFPFAPIICSGTLLEEYFFNPTGPWEINVDSGCRRRSRRD